jgi:endo-alpha-1,4-polygalactosaminidase (GH114 family)
MNSKFSIFALLPLLVLAASCDSTDVTSISAAPSGRSSRSVPTWSIQYEGKIVPRGKNYHIVDLFDVSSADLSALRASGSKPIAYFSSQYEKWRPDSAQFPKAAIGKKLGSWKGENWVDTKSPKVREIMRKRLDKAKSRGFAGVDIDNVDFYLANTGFAHARKDALDYIRFLKREAHARGLIFGLKNALELVPALKGEVDFFMNEEAHQHGDTGYYAGVRKPVFCVEYKRPKRGTPGIYTIYKKGAVMDAREEVIPAR